MNNKIIFLQPDLPVYRLKFFEGMYANFGDNFELYYSTGGLQSISKPSARPWAHALPRKLSVLNILFWQFGTKTISFGKGDCLVLTANPRLLSNFLLVARAWILGAKVVWWGHLRSATSSTLGTVLRIHLLRLGYGIIFYTDKEVSDFFERYAFLDEKFVIGLNNSIDDEQISTLRQPYCAEKREDRILFIGRLTQKARLDILIKAISSLKNINIKLDIIGDGPELPRLIEIAERFKVQGRISWHSSIIDEQDISKIVNKSKIFVYPGSVGLSLIHAMAYGLPTIIHDQGKFHMPEAAAFTDGVTGCSFIMNNTDDLAEKITNIISSNEKLNTMSKRSIQEISLNYNLKNMLQRVSELLVRIMNVER